MNIQINQSPFTVRHLAIAGWAGRDQAAVQHHIDELAALGVAPPSEIPLFYYVSPLLATQDNYIDFLGSSHSGEVEICLLCDDAGELWVSIASDHTDRALEAYSVAASKQICAKPIAQEAWRLTDVLAHWDMLEISANIEIDGNTRLYQHSTIAQLRHIDDLLHRLPEQLRNAEGKPLSGLLLLCGTVPAIGGIACQADKFSIQLYDPIRKRSISHHYHISNLPISQ